MIPICAENEEGGAHPATGGVEAGKAMLQMQKGALCLQEIFCYFLTPGSPCSLDACTWLLSAELCLCLFIGMHCLWAEFSSPHVFGTVHTCKLEYEVALDLLQVYFRLPNCVYHHGNVMYIFVSLYAGMTLHLYQHYILAQCQFD